MQLTLPMLNSAGAPFAPTGWFILLLGAIFGSFLNVCIMRLPEGSFWSSHRSKCTHCGALVPMWLNIPVFSYVLLRGRTRCCGNRLSPQYPIVELGTALLFAFLYWKFPFVTSYGIDSKQVLRFSHGALFASFLIVGSAIDLRLMIIPDSITLGLVALTPLVIVFHPELDWRSGLYGVLLGGGVIYGIAWSYVLLRKQEGIGMGDAKLLAGVGGWLGYQGVLPTLFYGALFGSAVGVSVLLVRKKFSMRAEIPFGPFLALGAMIHLLTKFHLSEIFSH